jgi:hypothetical protein
VRSEALAAVAGQLAGEDRRQVLRQALEAAGGMGDERSRAWALAAVAEQLAGEDRRQVLRQALEAAAGIGYAWLRAGSLGTGPAEGGTYHGQ